MLEDVPAAEAVEQTMPDTEPAADAIPDLPENDSPPMETDEIGAPTLDGMDAEEDPVPEEQ